MRLCSHVCLLLTLLFSVQTAVAAPKKAATPKPEKAGAAKGGADTSQTVVDTESVSMDMRLLVQAGFEAYPNQLEGRRNAFRLQRARLGLTGHLINKHIRYVFLGDGAAAAALAAPFGAPGSEMLSADGGVDVPFVLDANLYISIPKLRMYVTFGRFIPRWSLMMSTSPAKLGTIYYPLYIHGDRGSIGPFRDIGLEVVLALHRGIFLGGGVYNGGLNTWTDDNDRKDAAAFLTIRRLKGFTLRVSSLFKFPNSVDAANDFGEPIENGLETHIAPSVEARFERRGVDAIAGFAMRFAFRDNDDARPDYRSMGGFVHLGYLFPKGWFEIAARGEYWDPSDAHADDHRWRITAGPAFVAEAPHLKIGITYVQDIFASARGMCDNYLGLETCDDLSNTPEAQTVASTVFIQTTLDI